MKSRTVILRSSGCTLVLLLICVEAVAQAPPTLPENPSFPSLIGAVSPAPANILVVTSRPSSNEVLRRTVTYGDLDLDRREGVTVLHRRLERAVISVCTRPPTRNVASSQVFLRCKAQTMAAAVQAVNSAPLTAFHIAKGGAVYPVALTAQAPPSPSAAPK
jgi:UrcA family protein